jgi:hypothetical protein
VQIIKFLVMWFSPVSCSLVHLRPKKPLNALFSITISLFSLSMGETKFQTHKNSGKNHGSVNLKLYISG